MAPAAIVTTPGSASANAYCDVAYADQYHDNRPAVGTTWAAASATQKAAAILWATQLFDSLWAWTGYPVDAVQALQWPRGGMLKANGWEYVSLTAIPAELQKATAEYARQLLVSDRAGDSDVETQGIKQLAAGPVQLTFKDDVKAKPVPDIVVNLIPPSWGYPRGLDRGFRQLERA